MKNRVRYKEFEQISFADMMVYSKLPEHPFWSLLEKKIDFTFADELCSVLYSPKGQRPYAPSLKLKVHLVQTYSDLSDRQTEEKIMSDLFIKRFLGLPVDFFGFDHSTIGLDRSRMGATMFKACHFYILAQMRCHGLWGDHNEQWIIDSFAANVPWAQPSAYRLIQQAMISIFQHLKRSHRGFYQFACSSVVSDTMYTRFPRNASDAEAMLAFSKLVAQAYGLLQWFQLEEAHTLFVQELKEGTRRTSEQLQQTLLQILEQNSRLLPPDDDPSDHASDIKNRETDDEVTFEKIPRAQRPKDRVMSTIDPDARVGKKNKSTVIKGYKVQNLCTASGVILNMAVIPANEHDREAMIPMIRDVQGFLYQTPTAVLGDALYGHGKQRAQLAQGGISVVAPVPPANNPTQLYDASEFQYDPEEDHYLCPGGQISQQKRRISQKEGWQYYFANRDCQTCGLREACTTSKDARRVFRSDFQVLYEKLGPTMRQRKERQTFGND
ncbi:transposase [Bacillus horti]|uniref:Transposase n=1 Tax=Caldalkalibacillus horti TaxID=77523 RepID=A0ABT9W0E1_9BACI|nr:transposase [Bacillus horti]MDQ0166731.1 transposase [Bacillus horti]